MCNFVSIVLHGRGKIWTVLRYLVMMKSFFLQQFRETWDANYVCSGAIPCVISRMGHSIIICSKTLPCWKGTGRIVWAKQKRSNVDRRDFYRMKSTNTEAQFICNDKI